MTGLNQDVAMEVVAVVDSGHVWKTEWTGFIDELDVGVKKVIKNKYHQSLSWANGEAINKMKKAFMDALCSFIKSCLLIQMTYMLLEDKDGTLSNFPSTMLIRGLYTQHRLKWIFIYSAN